MSKPIVLPLASLNGSGKVNLSKQYRDAGRALDQALDALAQASPHGRDYYQGGEVFSDLYRAARAEHDARMDAVRKVREEMLAAFEFVMEWSR